MKRHFLLCLLLAGLLGFPSLAHALDPLGDTASYKRLEATVTKITASPDRYRKKGASREWALRNLSNGFRELKDSIWQRQTTRLDQDSRAESLLRASLEYRAGLDYQADLSSLGPARQLLSDASARLVALRSRVCRATYKKMRPGKTKASRKKARKVNLKRKRAALRRQKACRARKAEKIAATSDRVRQLTRGIEAYRQAFVNTYLDRFDQVEGALRSEEAKNRNNSNEATRSELLAAVRLANRGRSAARFTLLAAPDPKLDLANTDRSDFFGMVDAGNVDYRRAAASGVGMVRQNIWFSYSGGKADWTNLDRRFGFAAAHGIRKLPIVCPFSQTLEQISSAVKRYGNGGGYWRESGSPYYPVRVWEICNEPNLGVNNPDGQVSVGRYVAGLVRAANTIREADPSAIVLLGGLANVSTYGRNVSETEFLEQLYRRPEARSSFDGVSFHPYSPSAGESIEAVAELRRQLDKNDDSGKSIWITEIGWATSGPRSPYLVTPARQAENLTSFIGYMKERRAEDNIRSVFWYFWRDTKNPIGHAKTPDWDSFAGLMDISGNPKPSWSAWLIQTGGRDSR